MRLFCILLYAALAGCATYDVSRIVTPGMAKGEVGALVGKPITEGRLADSEAYWDYTRQPYGYYTYRVTFGPDERVLWYYSEWDPRVYSKRDGGGR